MKKKIDVSAAAPVKGDGNNDAVFMQRMRDGDMSAFEQVYYRWNKQVYAFMLKTTRSVLDAEDITQEVFVRLWNMHEHIDPSKNLQSLIFTIARRIAVDMYRRSGKMPVASSENQSDNDDNSMAKSPQELLEERETELLLDVAIESMPEKQRKVFCLYYRDNLSPQEISLRSGLTYDNVRKHIYNGKKQLREIVSMMVTFLLGGAIVS